MLRRHLPFAFVITFGLLTLVALLFGFSAVSSFVLDWAGFLAAMALIIGVLNLMAVHLHRLFSTRNFYSGTLVASLLAVFVLAVTDSAPVALTGDGVGYIFRNVQAPLEAAVASLVAFILLFSGFRLLQRKRNVWSVLFLATAVLMLTSKTLANIAFVPQPIGNTFIQVSSAIESIIVTAGMRGILIGVALGTITISIRLLLGHERPYGH